MRPHLPIRSAAVAVAVALSVLPAGTNAASPSERPVAAPAARRAPKPPFPKLLPAQPPSVLGERLVTVVLAEPFDGDRRGLDASVAADIVAKTAAIWARLSDDRIRLRLVRTIEWTEARAADACDAQMGIHVGRKVGWKRASNHHLVVIQPGDDCPWAGMAFQPGHRFGNYVWLGWSPSRNPLPNSHAETLAHEIGHNLILGHTSLAQCSLALRPACSTREEFPNRSQEIEYGGDDLMGGVIDQGTRSLNPIARWQLGLIKPAGLLTVDANATSSRVVQLAPAGRAGTQAIRIVGPDRRNAWWVSYDSTPQCEWGDWQPWCIYTGSPSEGVRVHVMLGDRFFPSIGQQRSDTGSVHLTVGTTYPFPGGSLRVVSMGAVAEIEIITDGS